MPIATSLRRVSIRTEIADDQLHIYLQTINRFPILSDSKVRKLIPRAKNGDEKAIEAIIGSLWKLVFRFAQDRSLLHPYTELTDLIQCGFWVFIRQFKSLTRKGVQFSSYAVWWIRNSIDRYFYGQKVHQSLDAMPDFNPLCRTSNPLHNAIFQEEVEYRREFLGRALKQLDPRSRRIVILRLGLSGAPEATLEVLSQILNLSRERVRQIYLRALEKLKIFYLGNYRF